MNNHPTVYVIAGPNGAGKTTFAVEFLPQLAGCRDFVNADLIARGLSPLDVDAVAVEAGRIFLRLIRSRIEACRSFAFETTLAGLTYVRLLQAMRAKKYHVRLYYLWIPTVNLTLKRIAERVRRGGHDIPDDTARRRYGKSLANLFRHYLKLTDYAAIFDNSSALPALVYERAGDRQRIVQADVFQAISKQARAIP